MAYRKRNSDNLDFTTSHDWNVIDDRSGFKIKASDARIDSEGILTHFRDVDPFNLDRIPLDFPVERPLPYTSPEPTYTFVADADTEVFYGPNLWERLSTSNWEDFDRATWENLT